jgi:hypothetical protein
LSDDQRDRLAQLRHAGYELSGRELEELHQMRLDADSGDLPSVLDAERRQDRIRKRPPTTRKTA